MIKNKFNNFKNIFYSVQKANVIKVISVGSIMFFMLFVYTMTRDLKNIFIQKFAIGGGAELISVIKLFFVIPCIFLFILIFEFLIDKFQFDKTFYIFISGFALFYLLFAVLFLSNYQKLHMSLEQIMFLQSKLPSFFYYIIPCIGNWIFLIFYLFSEVWGALVIPTLFWQFACKITKKNEVKTFFGLYNLMGNIGVIFSGLILKCVTKRFLNEGDFNIELLILISLCILSCFFMMLLYNKCSRKFSSIKATETTGAKITFKGNFKGFKYLAKSKYLTSIAIMLFAYGVSFDFIESVWYNYLKDNSSIENFSSIVGNLSMSIGVLTIIVTIISPMIITFFSWKASAILTPVIVGISGLVFFVFYFINKFLNINTLLGMKMCDVVIIYGLIALAASRSIKYGLFDPTRNMAYISLNYEEITKGQAAVESIGVRMGNLGVSAVNYTLTNLVCAGATIGCYLPIIFLIFSSSIFIWIKSIFFIDKSQKK